MGNGTHVVSKILKLFGGEEDLNGNGQNNDFIFEGLERNIAGLSTHKHGCCVLQRCYDVGSRRQRIGMQNAILNVIRPLSQDCYGNYVVQHLLTHDVAGGDFAQRVLAACHTSGSDRLVEFCCHKFSSNVIEACISGGSTTEAAAALLEGNWIQRLFADRFGNYVLQKALAVTEEREPELFRQLIEQVKPAVRMQGSGVGLKIMKRYPAEFVDYYALYN